MSKVTQQQKRKTCTSDISLRGTRKEVEIVSTDCSYLQMLNLGMWLDPGAGTLDEPVAFLCSSPVLGADRTAHSYSHCELVPEPLTAGLGCRQADGAKSHGKEEGM